ncbi:MAG: colicin V production protein [Aequorivita sp.]|nr:colicin V production protein [Aequorivita sp.]
MNTIDIVIGIILIIAFIMGFRKGLLRSLASLIGLVAGVYGGMFFSDYARVYLESWFDWSADLTNIAAFLITFLVIMLLFSLVGRILTKVADFAMMGLFNKLFGGVFNAFKFAFLLSVVFMFVNASENYRILSPQERDASLLYTPVAAIAPAILPSIIEEVDQLDLELPSLETNKEAEKDSIN